MYQLSNAVILNLGPPDVIGLQLPEAFTTTSAGQDFWELKSKNIWMPKVGDHWSNGKIIPMSRKLYRKGHIIHLKMQM